MTNGSVASDSHPCARDREGAPLLPESRSPRRDNPEKPRADHVATEHHAETDASTPVPPTELISIRYSAQRVGAGSFGDVFVAQHPRSAHRRGVCVVKRLTTDPRSRKVSVLRHVVDEIAALVALRGVANVVTLVEARYGPLVPAGGRDGMGASSAAAAGTAVALLDSLTREHPALVCVDSHLQPGEVLVFMESAVELHRGALNLKDWMRSADSCLFDVRGRINEGRAREHFLQLARALAECHGRGIALGDIKPENCMVRKAQRATRVGEGHQAGGGADDRGDDDAAAAGGAAPALLTLIDLGFAAPVRRDCNGHELPETTFQGSPYYLSPALVQHTKGYLRTKADVWALGVVLFMLLTGGSRPFRGATYDELAPEIVRAAVPIPAGLSSEAADLLRRLFNPDDASRLSAADVLRHPWCCPHASAPATTLTITKATPADARALSPAAPPAGSACGGVGGRWVDVVRKHLAAGHHSHAPHYSHPSCAARRALKV